MESLKSQLQSMGTQRDKLQALCRALQEERKMLRQELTMLGLPPTEGACVPEPEAVDAPTPPGAS